MSDTMRVPGPDGKPAVLLYRYEALTPDGQLLAGWFPDETTARRTLERAAGAN